MFPALVWFPVFIDEVGLKMLQRTGFAGNWNKTCQNGKTD